MYMYSDHQAMKKSTLILCGITCFVLGLGIILYTYLQEETTPNVEDYPILTFEAEEDYILDVDSIVVSFVVSDSTALATVENGTWRSTKTGKSEHVDIDAILIYNNEGEHYQNQQVIVLPKGKYLKRVGQYSYISNSNIVSVVSIVQIQ